MPKGRYPDEYFRSATNHKPIEQIYQDIDDFSMEYFADDPAFHSQIDLVVLLPPHCAEVLRHLKSGFYLAEMKS
ncbi:hypothetical protein [Novipirellula caenicola]|uniref:NERD domain-containing protein n=1 Tax=Novipirellula caenicola TaxID=1536901 RepID=A0ABP9VMW7_9BACT